MPGLASGTITLFKQASAPTGWTKLTDVNDCTLRIVSGDTISNGGSVPVANFFTTPQVVTAPVSVTGFVNPAKATLPSHSHIFGYKADGDMGWYAPVNVYSYPGAARGTWQSPWPRDNGRGGGFQNDGFSEAALGIGTLSVFNPGGYYPVPFAPPGDCDPHNHPLSGTGSIPVTIGNTINVKYVDVIRARRN